MPTKPNPEVLHAYDKFKDDPKFSHDTLEAIINDNPMLRQALINKGLVKEVGVDA